MEVKRTKENSKCGPTLFAPLQSPLRYGVNFKTCVTNHVSVLGLMGLLTWIQLWASVFRRGERTCVGSLQSPMPSFMSELDIQIPSAFGMFFQSSIK